MGDEQSREQAQARNLARHLNERHPDTMLFLAQQAGGRLTATAAELTTVDEAGMTFTVHGDQGPELLRVPFPPVPDGDARTRFGALLRSTRAAGPSGPLTSLELMHTGPGGTRPA